MQYEVLQVDWYQNKEKYKLLDQSLVPRYWWAKYFEVWACSAWDGIGGWSECLDSNLLLLAVVSLVVTLSQHCYRRNTVFP